MNTLQVWFCAAVALAASQAGAATVFSDTEFDDADWSAAFEIVDETSNDSAAFTGAQSATGGNPGKYRRVSNSMDDTAGGTRITGGHLKLAAVYDPGVDGALATLDFAFDLIGFSGPAGAMGAGFLIEQGGKHFGRGVTQALNGAGWQARGLSGLTALDFVAFDGGTLDFGIGGDAMTFGFYSSNGTFGDSLNIGGVDNWSVTLTKTPVDAVPIPGALPFLLSAVLGLFAVRLRARRT